DPTWYNQDGAIRTLVAVAHDATSSPADFRAWSLGVFISLLAFDAVRILIWLDHMGLRVATLVNLSFLGMDRVDRRLARLLAPGSTARCIPEGVKRFTTWAPLLIPFYIPRGADWDTAWSRAETLRAEAGGGPLATFAALPIAGQAAIAAGAVAAATIAFAIARRIRARSAAHRLPVLTLANAEYEVSIRGDGEVVSRAKAKGTTSAGGPTTSSTRPAARSSSSMPTRRRPGPGCSSATRRARRANRVGSRGATTPSS
ncbi:MAG: hypothetical protein WKF75_21460, partial [Singulisphaera sp.]